MSDDTNDLDARDAADIAAPWAGYQWKVRELIDRAQAAEADCRRLRERVAELEGFVSDVSEMFDGQTAKHPPAIGRWGRSLLDTPHSQEADVQHCGHSKLAKSVLGHCRACDFEVAPPDEPALCTDGFHHCGHWRDGETCCACGDERDEREG